MDVKDRKLSNRDLPTIDYSETEPENEGEDDAELERQLREKLTAADRQYAAQPNVPKRIHIVGTGSIGKLVAHALKGIPNPPPITLILHRYALLQAWEKSNKVITVQDGGYDVPRRGFDVELKPETRMVHGQALGQQSSEVYDLAEATGVQPHQIAEIMVEEQKKAADENGRGVGSAAYKPMEGQGPLNDQKRKFKSQSCDYPISNEPIHNLIITTKTIRTVTALLPIKHRLSRSSTICFLQNGMGVIDVVNKEVFPDEATRPTYVQGIISHGANVPPEKAQQDPFYAVHAGHGTISLGIIPRKPLNSNPERPPTPSGPGTNNDGRIDDRKVEDWAPSARYLLRTLTRTPVLCAVGVTPIELFQSQLEKLAVNCVVNPLTCLLDNRNGHLLYNMALTRTMRLMLAEISLIIKNLPELRGIPNVPNRFSPELLETKVVAICRNTKDNISSMLADMRRGQQTEIEFMNGYIIRRGEEMGVKAVVNYAIMQTVIGKTKMVMNEIQGEVPVRKSLNYGED